MAVGAELDLPTVGGRVVAGFDDAVVVCADEDEVREGGIAAVPPGPDVVGVAGLGWIVTAGEGAALAALFEGGPGSRV